MGSGAAASHPPPPPISTPPPSRPSEPEKEFKCPTCNRVFNKKANLKVHSRKHTGEKPYACSRPGCGRSFMWKSSVTFHEQNCPSLKKPPSATSPPSTRTPLTSSTPSTNANSGTIVQNRLASRGVQKRPKGASAAVATLPLGVGASPVSHASRKRRAGAVEPDNRAEGSRGARQRAKLATERVVGARSVVGGGGSGGGGTYSPPPVHTLFAEADAAAALPAPAVLLAGKRMSSGGGKPPMIPGVRGLYSLPKESGNGKVLFDLRVPAGGGGKGGGLHVGKMPKMPIAMELGDSDDEGAEKIVGAQDAFMRTGNPFGGFAPPTRCSPLPISSPIVCPGISPMPLSPLAPFSPLPPDSPAHNAPNPVHPPLNQPTVRPNTPGW